MTAERWQRVFAVLDQALDTELSERVALLDLTCAGDADLRAQVEALLEADRRAGGPLDAPLEDVIPILMPELETPRREAPRAGERIGAWRLVRELGRGGMGEVFLAERVGGDFEQRAALKLARPGVAGEEVLRRFVQERQILARLEHPGIARLLDGGLTPAGQPYFVMEHVEGRPITEDCDARRLTIAERLRLFLDACDAVSYAHRNLVVHRDLKPANILVTPDGRSKLLDFGIAKLLSSEGTVPDVTLAGAGPMTPAFAAPEQVRGDAVTTATDVYALGLVLYELLGGVRAQHVASGRWLEVERAVLEHEPSPPSVTFCDGRGDSLDRASPAAERAEARRSTPARLRRALAGDLDTIVRTALRKEPERRYPSVEALASDIQRHLGGLPISARPDRFAYRAGKFIRRHRVGVTAVAAVLVALSAGLGLALHQAGVARHEAAKSRAVRDFVVGLFETADPAQSLGREPTASDLLGAGVERAEDELADQPDVRAEMLHVLGSVYVTLGRFAEARPLLERAVDLRRALHGSDSELVAETLNFLAYVLYQLDDLPAAEAAAREMVRIRERSTGASAPETAVAVNTLSLITNARGALDETVRLRRRVLEIDRRVYGEEHAEIATDLANLASVLRTLGRYAEANSAYVRALDLRRKLLPAGHPAIADAIGNLARLRSDQGRHADAERLQREALEIRRAALGDSHPDVALSLHGLGAAAMNQDRFDEADSLYAAALRIRRDVYGPRNRAVAETLNQMAVLAHRRGDLTSALNRLREVVEIFRAVHGEEHERTLTATASLGRVLAERGEHEEAERLLREALAGQRKALGPRHEDVASTLVHLGTLLTRTKRLADAASACREALAIYDASLPEDHPQRVQALAGLGAALTAEGRSAEALNPLRRAESLARRSFGEGSVRTAEVRLRLAAALAANGRASEARGLLEGSLETLVRVRGEQDSLTREAREALRGLQTS